MKNTAALDRTMYLNVSFVSECDGDRIAETVAGPKLVSSGLYMLFVHSNTFHSSILNAQIRLKSPPEYIELIKPQHLVNQHVQQDSCLTSALLPISR